MPCLTVLKHQELHDHTRGINTFAYGEFFYLFISHQQHCSIDSTTPALSLHFFFYQPSFIEASCPLVDYHTFLPCISYHHFSTLASAAEDIFY
jgi:hypothetical protein